MRQWSTVGRPRMVTDEQIRLILQWHDAMLAWKAQRGLLRTLRQLAREIGVSRGTVSTVIGGRSEYKQACPSTRPARNRAGSGGVMRDRLHGAIEREKSARHTDEGTS